MFIAYIALNPISTFLRQFYLRDTVIFFIIAALIIRWFDQIVSLKGWTYLDLDYIKGGEVNVEAATGGVL